MALSWAQRKQYTYLGVIGVIVLFCIGLLVWPYVTKAPTCMDNTQNGTELGVDCGGSCLRVCSFMTEDIKVLWARSFPVTETVYNAVAYIENQNTNSAVASIPYEFRLYDENNILVATRTGATYITPNAKSAIFEAGIDVGNRPPTTVRFRFLTETPTWVKFSQADIDAIPVLVKNQTILTPETTPKVTAEIFNRALVSIPDLEVVAIVYDKDNNALQVSKTVLARLLSNETKTIAFTWPQSFSGEAVRTELIPRINIFSTRPH